MYHLTDFLLVEALNHAIENDLDDQFISLLNTERLQRGIALNRTNNRETYSIIKTKEPTN